jgi:hypothetical protein
VASQEHSSTWGNYLPDSFDHAINTTARTLEEGLNLPYDNILCWIRSSETALQVLENNTQEQQHFASIFFPIVVNQPDNS